MANEPKISINGKPLTNAQAMAVRVAISSFESDLNSNGLGSDEHGEAMTAGYLDRIEELHTLMIPVESRIVLRLRIGKKTFRIRRGNYSCRRFVPFVERGPFGCWLASWSWCQMGWELTRWS